MSKMYRPRWQLTNFIDTFS